VSHPTIATAIAMRIIASRMHPRHPIEHPLPSMAASLLGV
jgi:hypothetical protein